MLIIQLVLLFSVVILLFFFTRRRHSVRMQAGKRIAFFGFIAFCVYAVARPDDLTVIARLVGVGRGADLLLYLLAVAFIFLAFNTYLRFRGIDQRFTDLARAIAIREAELVNRERGLNVFTAAVAPQPVHEPEDTDPTVAETEAAESTAAEKPAASTTAKSEAKISSVTA
ncbi:DUF2304 domain-containing protein [Crossiella sp. SN42]|uniref:DUF2304 domain-containing protein n=1 Tax=Crossiella sp. SN42 TaxID=2944808 RepID=UPI00207D42F1|nr:DUF2304 domain-containing protein [Crossiella sp. SN42]MCO1581541.1 DUF2304 domain-containing protein [Crossiella sp. SN42]